MRWKEVGLYHLDTFIFTIYFFLNSLAKSQRGIIAEHICFSKIQIKFNSLVFHAYVFAQAFHCLSKHSKCLIFWKPLLYLIFQSYLETFFFMFLLLLNRTSPQYFNCWFTQLSSPLHCIMYYCFLNLAIVPIILLALKGLTNEISVYVVLTSSKS